jgi:hypothetical protein
VEPDRLAVEDLAELEPGNALAATSESTAVRATLPAISQRFARCSRFIAASRSKRLWWIVMQ